jgi:hypothetical protein
MRERDRVMQPILWGGAITALLLAVGSGVGESRRQKRRDLDRVGFMPWAMLQVLAMLGAVILVSVALNLR